MPDNLKPDELVEVVIKSENHEHGGEKLEPGAKISVDAETAAWMLEHDIIEG